MNGLFLVEAFNLFDSINIKAIRNALSGKVVDSTPRELQVQYAPDSYCFVYRFGCIVFFNVDKSTRDLELQKLKDVLSSTLAKPTSETFQVKTQDGPSKVEFEHVELKKLTMDQLRIIAVTVGQSAALEYFEIEADRTLADTAQIMGSLSRGSGVPFMKTKNLMQIIGKTAAARQHIISNIAILDPPDETWKSKELESLFRAVQDNFDIDTRFKSLDRKLTLAQDNIEILADLSSAQRNTFLEALIVLLIVIELVFALVLRH